MNGGAPPMTAGSSTAGATFDVQNEDHTLANSLRYFLNKKCVKLAFVGSAAGLWGLAALCRVRFAGPPTQMPLPRAALQPAGPVLRLQHPTPHQ